MSGRCINTEHLSAVKRMLLARSIAPLEGVAKLAAIVGYVRERLDDVMEIHDGIVSERVLTLCRDREDEDEDED